MKLFKMMTVFGMFLVVALCSATVTSELYRWLKYSDVPKHETDIFFDIGLVFLITFIAVLGVSWLFWRKNR